MADEDAKLSYEELEDLLRRSAALQARRGTATFTKQDLLNAAKELGVDAQIAGDLVDTHLARRRATELAPRPFDTRIELSVAAEQLSLTIPPLRPTARHLGPLAFSGFWLAFVSFWTWGAAHGSALFAMFSLPFWAVGLGMLARSALPLVQRTRLTLSSDGGGELEAKPFGKRRALRTSELRVRIGEHVRFRQEGTSAEKAAGRALLLEHGVDTIPLLDGFSEQEQRWIEGELKAWLPNA